MKSPLLIILTLLLSFSTFGQSNTPPAQTPQSQPQDVWETVSPMDEEFSIETPTFEPVEFASGTGPKKAVSRNYKDVDSNNFFIIFSELVKELLPVPENSYTDGVLKYAEFFNPVISSSKIAGLDGKFYQFTDAENFHYKTLFVKTKTRSYVFLSIGRIKDDPKSERFFKSLRIDKKPSPIAVSVPNNNPISAISGDSQDAAPSGSSQGSARSIPIPSNISEGSRLPVQPNQTSKIRITSKPRAYYTDLARFFAMAGRVRVRVTFLSTGEIGSVAVVKSLPFGLTQKAVEAAKGIKFEPALKNGLPIATTVIVEYGFTIY